MSCSTSSSETPRCSTASRNTSLTCTVSWASSPEDGSSSRRTDGRAARARAISTNRVIPSDRVATGCSATRVRRRASSRVLTRLPSSASARRKPRAVTMSDQIRVRLVLTRSARITCSRTVRPLKISGCWNVRASPRRARCCTLARVMSVPSNWTVPPFGRRSPDSTENRVLLPAPFGPISPTMLAGGMTSETEPTATTPPNRTATSWHCRRGRAAAVAPALTGSPSRRGRSPPTRKYGRPERAPAARRWPPAGSATRPAEASVPAAVGRAWRPRRRGSPPP